HARQSAVMKIFLEHASRTSFSTGHRRHSDLPVVLQRKKRVPAPAVSIRRVGASARHQDDRHGGDCDYVYKLHRPSSILRMWITCYKPLEGWACRTGINV